MAKEVEESEDIGDKIVDFVGDVRKAIYKTDAEEEAEKQELMSKRREERTYDEEALNLVVFLRNRCGIHFTLDHPQLTDVKSLMKLVCVEQDLPDEAMDVFSLWIVSPYLELRLKSNHNPFEVVHKWDCLLAKYTDASNDDIHNSQPVLMVQRDVFFTKEQEKNVTNKEVLSLLYHEAKYNVIEGRYILHIEDYHYLAGIQALIHWGSYDAKTMPISSYRSDLIKFYPSFMLAQPIMLFNFARLQRNQPTPIEESFRTAHMDLSDKLQHVISKDNPVPLFQKYLQVLWSYPFYGGAFFDGLVEAKVSQLKRLIVKDPDLKVRVCINGDGIALFDKLKNDFMLYIPHNQLSWNWNDLPWDGDEDPPPELIIQFRDEESEGSKILHVFSRAAQLMDALIQTCVERKHEVENEDFVDGNMLDNSEKKLLNKLNRMSLDTYTED